MSAEFARFEIVILVLLVLGGSVAVAVSTDHDDDLKMNYYNKSCPDAENIVQEYVKEFIKNHTSFAPSLIRLQFHDCFIRGCDASVLLDFSPFNGTGNKTEKFAPPNLSLRGFEFINNVKRSLEDKCPGIVSCADIIALVSRDAVAFIGGPSWYVPLGRRDGNVSNGSETLTELPFPTDNITTLETKFAKKGLNLTDLVVLSGAHTIGNSHCTSFTNRLYNFTGKADQDPKLNRDYAKQLKEECPKNSNSTQIVEMDPHPHPLGSNHTPFDLSYYRMVSVGKGLFTSDGTLLTKDETEKIFMQLMEGTLKNFFEHFAASMEKMARIGVLTGSKGEIRKNCALIN